MRFPCLQGQADGELFMDDGHTFDFRNGKYNYKKLTFENNKLSSKYVVTELIFNCFVLVWWLELPVRKQ